MRIVLSILAGVAALIAHVFSLAMAFFLITWFFMMGLVAAGLGKRDGIRTTLIGLSMASAALVVGFGSLEMVFRIPSVAARWGTPAERSAWDSRYDRVWQENAFGFRSRHETVARLSGVNRAVVLGDSFTS